MDQSIFDTTNQLRTDPTSFIEYLENRLQYFDGDILWLPGRNGLRTNEGPAAVEEAIEYLQSVEPIAALEWRSGMARACEDHVNDTGAQGLTGHSGTDGSSPYERMDRYGSWGRSAAENISYGSNSGIDVVM